MGSNAAVDDVNVDSTHTHEKSYLFLTLMVSFKTERCIFCVIKAPPFSFFYFWLPLLFPREMM